MSKVYSIWSKLFLGAAVAASLAATAAPARAQTADKMQVNARDLDLRTLSGQAELRHRVAVAARKLCGPPEIPGSIYFDSYNQCVQDTIRSSNQQVASLIAAERGDTMYAAAVLVGQ